MSDFWILLLALGVIVVPMALAWVLLGQGQPRKKPRPGSPPDSRPGHRP